LPTVEAAVTIAALPVAALALWALLRAPSAASKLVAQPTGERWHERATPTFGGVGIACGLAAGVALAIAVGAVDADAVAAPFGNSRRLVTKFDVKGDARRAHSSVVPGNAAAKGADGKFLHEAVWRYLFTHPVEQVGKAVPIDPDCGENLPKSVRE
jgi:hypothetical protein